MRMMHSSRDGRLMPDTKLPDAVAALLLPPTMMTMMMMITMMQSLQLCSAVVVCCELCSAVAAVVQCSRCDCVLGSAVDAVAALLLMIIFIPPTNHPTKGSPCSAYELRRRQSGALPRLCR